MADFRLSAKIIKRSIGQSSVAAAAYRSADRFDDERTGITHDYTRKGGVVHAEILAPEQTPDWMFDRQELWNAVEKVERRKDAQLAREIQLSLPHELTDEQRLTLVRGFVQEQFVDHGMIADLAVHHPDQQSDTRNHHAHVMLTMRELSSDGFGKKNRDWNNPELLNQWRERWAHHQNRELARHGHDVRVDHRSLEEQGIDREPQKHMGQTAHNMEENGKRSRVGDENRNIAERNAKRAQNRAMLSMVTAQITKERRALDRFNKNRTAKVAQVEKQLGQSMAERQGKEKQALDQKLHRDNAVAKATLSREIQTISTRLDSAKGWKRIMRTAFGRTRTDQKTRIELGRALQTIKQHEGREIKRLEKTHALEHKRGKTRIDRLKRRVEKSATRRREQLNNKHQKLKTATERKAFKDRLIEQSKHPEENREQKIVNDNRPEGMSKDFTKSSSATTRQAKRDSKRQSSRQAGRLKQRDDTPKNNGGMG